LKKLKYLNLQSKPDMAVSSKCLAIILSLTNNIIVNST